MKSIILCKKILCYLNLYYWTYSFKNINIKFGVLEKSQDIFTGAPAILFTTTLKTYNKMLLFLLRIDLIKKNVNIELFKKIISFVILCYE